MNTITERVSNSEVHLVPGKLLLEVRNTPDNCSSPLSHDVETVARELGILVAKIDSTQYPELVKDLKVQQFPTLILYDENGREQKRCRYESWHRACREPCGRSGSSACRSEVSTQSV